MSAPISGRAHAALDTRMHVTQRGDGHVVRGLHERELGGRFDHAASANQGITRHDIVGARGLAHAVDNEEPHGRLHGDMACTHTAVAQPLHDRRERAVRFVPGPHVAADQQGLAHRGLLEGRRHDEHVAACGNDGGGGALGAAPANAGEVLERCAGLDQQRADLALLHECLHLGDARAPLGRRYRMRIAGDRLELRRRARLPRRRPRRRAGVAVAASSDQAQARLKNERRPARIIASAAARISRASPA